MLPWTSRTLSRSPVGEDQSTRDSGQPAAASATAMPAASAWRESMAFLRDGCHRLAIAAATNAATNAMPCTPTMGAQPAMGLSTCA
ncbi:hypothetical protein G6F35_018888 [Rhizopus arrhizus]|nr:hypothetical protein G6F35_018888 [Rhizopus arrhizus]